MKFFPRKRAFDKALGTIDTAADLAGEFFDRGFNCARSVLQATTGSANPELLAATDGFSCGIGRSGCLCGAITGGVMALGLGRSSGHSGQLVAEFKQLFRTTCCRGLSADYLWMSREHLANCRRITVTTAAMVEALLKK